MDAIAKNPTALRSIVNAFAKVMAAQKTAAAQIVKT